MDIEFVKAEDRVIFLDNLRVLLVVLVILEHAGNAYTGLNWWPVADANTSEIAGWLSAISDAVAMPLFFYIAGYFALPSIEKKGSANFFKGKLRRLGVPWVVCLLTICPILPLVYHFTRNGFSFTDSYWGLWVGLLENAAQFDTGIIASMNDMMMVNGFYQRYMWFLSLLIAFFLVFSLVYGIRKSWFIRIDSSAAPNEKSPGIPLKFLLGVGLATTLCSFGTVGAMLAFGPASSNPEPLFTLGNIIQFRPSRLAFFIIYFVFGLLTYRNRWIERATFPGPVKGWTAPFSCTLIAFLVIRHQMNHGPEVLEELFGMIYFLVMNFLTITALGMLMAVGLRDWNRQTVLGSNLASNAFNMYLSHYIFVIVFQLIFLTQPDILGIVKFALVSTLSAGCAYGVSQYVIKPYPRTTIAALATLFLAMVVLIRP